MTFDILRPNWLRIDGLVWDSLMVEGVRQGGVLGLVDAVMVVEEVRKGWCV